MNHREKLLTLYNNSHSVGDITNIPEQYQQYILTVGEKVLSQKGVYTVLVTLLTHKTLHPEQDIRFHQSHMDGGFSGRTIDATYITPTLKALGLPSMAESGWLTRSLEQPYPYTLDYNGKISNKAVKKAFLNILDYVERKPKTAENLIRLLLHHADNVRNENIVPIVPLVNQESITIQIIITLLDQHFSYSYKTFGGSKLPVIAFHAIYQSLLDDVKRYEGCTMSSLGSHVASDRTSKTAGDIELHKDDTLFEAIEIKHDKQIDITIVRIAYEKIIRYNPQRYYILSHKGVDQSAQVEIDGLVEQVRREHGCQIIINGVLPTLKYYLRLIVDIPQFIANYSSLVSNDPELKKIHKTVWNQLLTEHNQTE